MFALSAIRWPLVAVVAFMASCKGDAGEASSANGMAPAAPSRDALEGLGVAGRFHFEMKLEPATPELGQLFRVVTTVRDAQSGRFIEHASFTLDATMPTHDHGMMTQPQHRELGEGRYLSEGMKLHMPGPWEFSATARTGSVEDSIALPYESRVGEG